MIAIISCLLALYAAPGDDARALLQQSIDAMGGRTALQAIHTLRLETIGHNFYIEQSERPEGPFIVGYQSGVEDRDVAGGRSRLVVQQRSIQAPDWTPGQATVVGPDAAAWATSRGMIPASATTYEEGRERLELAPERLLFAALAAPDLAGGPDVRRQGMSQKAVTFTWRGQGARLLLNPFDHLPTALELTRVDPQFDMWGTVTEATYYSLWSLLPGGVRYPMQIDREWNGVSKGSTTIVRATVNPSLDESALAIPDAVKTAFAAAPPSGFSHARLNASKSRDVAPGVVQYAGSWNVEVVRQPDGLVVIEAPFASEYSAQVIDELAKAYPGAKVKALVTTSDAWPHLGGVREYAARGIPIYALDLNRGIIERLMKADYSAQPDALARKPRAGNFTWVSAKTVIGSGDTRIELYPARAENGEREMFAYFPALKLLYSSDEIQPLPRGGFFMPEYLLEVKDVVTREHLDVERVFGMHLAPTPWKDIEAAMASAVALPAGSASFE